MEEVDLLDPLNEVHLFCLHFVYEKHINNAINLFVDAWSTHPLRTERNRSPIQLWIEGMMANPSYFSATEEVDECVSLYM